MNNNKEIYLCSFASPDLNRSVKRFKNQAENMGIYKEIKVYGFNDLNLKKKNQIENFKKEKLNRLFGYACWKPDIILNYLNLIPDNAILQYSDIGCHLNSNGFNKLNEYIRLTKKNNILAFQYKSPEFKKYDYKYQIYYENEYTKGDLINYFNLSYSDEIVHSEQFWSGSVFFKNNQISKSFVKKWDDICSKDDRISDKESKVKNHKNFIEHRHDQSVFSILCKLNNVKSISASEAEWAEDEKDKTWKHLKEFPILAKRDKKFNFLKRFINRQKRNIRRFFKR